MVCSGLLLGCILMNLVTYVCWEMRKPGVYHVPKFGEYLQLFFVYSVSRLRVKLGLSPEKSELLFEKLFLESVGQPSGNQGSDYNCTDASKEEAHRPNENKMSDGGRGRASLGVKVWKSSQKWSVRRSAVRSIAWLGLCGFIGGRGATI